MKLSELSLVDELNKLACLQCMGRHSSAGRALQRERRGHGFESRWSSEKLFSGVFRNCLNCDLLRWSHIHFFILLFMILIWWNIVISIVLFNYHCLVLKIYEYPSLLSTKMWTFGASGGRGGGCKRTSFTPSGYGPDLLPTLATQNHSEFCSLTRCCA